MNHKHLFFLWLCLFSCPLFDHLFAEQFCLSGIVTDSITQKPIENAYIDIIRNEKERFSTHTDSDGKYQIKHILPGSYILITKASGFVAKSDGFQVVSNQNIVQNVSLVPQDMKVSGTILDCSTEKPIARAIVKAFVGDTFISSTTTDSQGRYALKPTNLEGLILTISFPGYESRSVGIYERDENRHDDRAEYRKEDTGTDNIELCLKPKIGAVISGIVKDAKTQNPIPNAEIIISCASSCETVVTDSTGAFFLENALKGGFYNLTVNCDGYDTAISSVLIECNKVYFTEFSLKKSSGTVCGKVLDASEKLCPISNAVVEIYENTILIASTIVDSCGNFDFSDLPYGNYIIVVNANTYQSQSRGISIESKALNTEFALQPNPLSVFGSVIDAETLLPIAGAVIRVMKNSVNLPNFQSAADGTFLISGLKLGSYTMVISAQNYQNSLQGLTLSENQDTPLNVFLNSSPGSLFGKISSESFKLPISGASVQIYKGSILVASAITDHNGDYLIPNLAPHSYSLLIDASGYQRSIQNIEIGSDSQTVTNSSLKSWPGMISGRIYDLQSSAPIAGATVRIFSNDLLVGVTQSDEQGNYAILNLAPGVYQIFTVASGYQSKSLLSQLLEQSPRVFRFSSMFTHSVSIDFPLVPGGSVMTVTAKDPCLNLPLSGAAISLNNLPIGITDTFGQWHFSGLPIGAIENLTISKPGFVTANIDFEVLAGGPSSLNINVLPLVLGPTSITCKTLTNKFLVNQRVSYQLSWTASPSPCVVGYQIKKDQVEVGNVSSDQELTFIDHRISTKKSVVYSVYAINAFGIISPGITITVR
ncbi:MAG TPA: carboxypeptidase regulatory-like domain-containing protein [Chlamydiales bacterium]|nr:carboxypeptidase regulatory-like domain-containing protein [Chlamydiales bacterium]